MRRPGTHGFAMSFIELSREGQRQRQREQRQGQKQKANRKGRTVSNDITVIHHSVLEQSSESSVNTDGSLQVGPLEGGHSQQGHTVFICIRSVHKCGTSIFDRTFSYTGLSIQNTCISCFSVSLQVLSVGTTRWNRYSMHADISLMLRHRSHQSSLSGVVRRTVPLI